ncbi:MAG: DUF4197 family protein [Candidatus Eisenbacteria bacterium]|nr:DUF4197 family protein [Candidatus Eisenbacteria bacterium]
MVCRHGRRWIPRRLSASQVCPGARLSNRMGSLPRRPALVLVQSNHPRVRGNGRLRGDIKALIDLGEHQGAVPALTRYRIHEDLSAAYDRLPFVETPALDLDAHMVNEALDGLITVLAVEEKKIREDPAARTTQLLRRVFGRSGSTS